MNELEQILHDIHEAHDVHYTPASALITIVSGMLSDGSGASLSDVQEAIWDWRLSNRVVIMVDNQGNSLLQSLPWYMEMV